MAKQDDSVIIIKFNFWLLILVPIIIGVFFFIVKTYTSSPQISTTNVLAKDNLLAEFGKAYLQEGHNTGKTINIDLTATLSTVEIFPDHPTKVWTYNGQIPGPTIRLKLGETLRVNFTNKLPQATTIHWHGVRVPNNMDGVPNITQKPIAINSTFVYEFTPPDAGTFWFHPHVRGAEQVERGLVGTLIVEDSISKQYDQDVVWVVDDWLLEDTYQINTNFVSSHDLMHDGRWGNVITVNGSIDEKLLVKPGERIRLRLVNTSNARIYQPNFGDLSAMVIAIDGMYVRKPFPIGDVELAPGNRIDVDIKIPLNGSKSNYSVSDLFTKNKNVLGKLVVSEKPVLSIKNFAYPKNKLVPLWKTAINLPVDQKFVLNARMAKDSSRGMGMMGNIEWTINGKAFPDYETTNLRYKEFTKLSFVNKSSRLHPMHLHGQFFKVLSRNGKLVNEEYFRDTVLIHPEETVEVGVIALNKGRWVEHCHILEHAEAGMLTVIEVK